MRKMKRSRKGGKEKERVKRRGRDRIQTWTEEKKAKKRKEKVHGISESRNGHESTCACHTCTTMNETLRNDKELLEFYVIFYLLRFEGGRWKRAVSKGEWGKVGVET